jgi:hypothetical protein
MVLSFAMAALKVPPPLASLASFFRSCRVGKNGLTPAKTTKFPEECDPPKLISNFEHLHETRASIRQGEIGVSRKYEAGKS